MNVNIFEFARSSDRIPYVPLGQIRFRPIEVDLAMSVCPVESNDNSLTDNHLKILTSENS